VENRSRLDRQDEFDLVYFAFSLHHRCGPDHATRRVEAHEPTD
jgi:hypothetical protein